MATNFEKAVWVIAALVFLPALTVMGGFLVALAIAAAILGTFYGVRYGARVYEQQNVGKRAGRFDLNQAVNRDENENRWGRK